MTAADVDAALRKGLAAIALAIAGLALAATGGILALNDDVSRRTIAGLTLPGAVALFFAVKMLLDVVCALLRRLAEALRASGQVPTGPEAG